MVAEHQEATKLILLHALSVPRDNCVVVTGYRMVWLSLLINPWFRFLDGMHQESQLIRQRKERPSRVVTQYIACWEQ